MSFIDLFSDKSDLYAAARPQYPKDLYEFLASCTSPRKRAWDCGAGNGQSSISLVEYFSEVYATDASEQQIANAIQKKCVFYSIQPGEKTRFANDYFDIVTVAQALHWFNLDRFWPEVTRVLRSGGIFAAWGYDWFSISPEIDDVIKESILDVIAPYWSPRAHLVWDGYRDVGFPFEPISVPPMTMKVLWNLSELLNYLRTWSATRQCVQQQGTEFFEIFSKRLLNVWGQAEERKEIIMNFHIIAGRNQLK
ncbi:class I SAM-dependent methyltransferase [Chamaesiphon sp. VAR_48_metabat_403]|uniref:class I SAM-dependent methyltransferase n=1 Tax=Chamaesiphon sp. VAR_48_metabat_403 TaxID=2964700 RepID=UPI00286EB2EB|nr:class I SAM-dependent methyltransferase [Chamaesiphon sp. VAR_48_metabat_403]